MSGTVSKHGPGWRARWYDDSGTRRSKSGFATKKDAQTFLANRDRERKLGLVGEGLTVETLIREYLDTSTSSEERIDRVRQSLKHVTFGGLLVRNLTPSIIVRWRATLATENLRWDCTRALKQVLRYAEDMRYIDRSPAASVKNPQPKAPDVNPFASWAEVEALDALLGGVPTVAVGTGMRPQEWTRLEWSRVDLEGRCIYLPASIAKGGKARRIPLRDRVVRALDGMPHRDGLVLGVRDLRSWRRYEWAPALTSLGMEYRRPYEMRHTYATWALRAGLSTFMVARRMGTSLLMIDQTYGQFAVDSEQHELRMLDSFDGGDYGASRLEDKRAYSTAQSRL